MKLKQLFAAALFLFSAGAWAQTDVTSTYLTNADFEADEALTSTYLYGYGKDGSPYGFQPITGWTPVVLNGASDGGYANSGMAGGVFSYGSATQLKGNAKEAPATNPNGEATGKCFGFFGVWGCGGYYYQDVNLAAGHYTITVPMYNQSGTQSNTTYTGFFPTSGTNRTVAVNPTVGQWVNQTVTFDLAVATEGQIRIGYQSTGSGSGANPMLFIDCVKIEYTDPLQASKDALQAEINTVTNEYATELATAIATAQDVLDNATTEAELTEAKTTLHDVYLRYKNGLTAAAYNNPVVTDFVVNGTFDSGISPWQRTGTYQNNQTANNKQGAFTGNFYENWNGSAQPNKMYQTINNIPNGTYRLDIAAFVNRLADPNESQYVFANSDKVYLTTGEPTAYEVYTVVTDNQIEVGLEQTTATANWMGIDNVSLRYYGAGNVINDAKNASHKQAWLEAKAAAEAAIADAAYTNVTGSEKTALQAEIDKTEPTTAQGYDAAAAALATATQDFVNAKPSYDAYANEKANADRISTTIASGITAPTTAAGCDAVTKSILVGEYSYVAANFNADAAATYGITIDQWTGTATSGGNSDTPQTNSGEKWGDAATTYYEQGRNGWGSSAWTLNYTKTVRLPASTYVLKVAARASAGVTATLKATVGETTITEALPNVGNTGFGITTTGVASFDDNDTFANSDNGYGWQWRYLAFTLEDEGEVTLQIDASANSNHQWCSFSDVAVVSNVSTTALETAYNNFTMPTLGFENGQYAPYNNVAVLEAYAEAAAIIAGTSVPSTQTEVDAITSTLTNPSWTANDGDVDAIYNGTFAEANGTNPKGWTRSNNGWGQQITDLSAEANGVAEGTTTAWYYNTNGSWQYGNDGIYVMPLAANQAYELSFKYSKHGSDWQNWMKASVVNSSNEGMEAVEFEAAENGTTFVTAKAYFTTGAAGNYILSIEQNGNAHLTDVSLVKAASATLALNEGVTYEAIDRTYYETVELTRNVVDGFNTVCLPFDLTAEQVASVFGNGAKIYNFEDVADGTNSTINFNTKDDNTIAANVPVLIGEATASTDSKIINNVVLKSGEAKVVGTNFDFVGTYATITVAEDDYFIGAGALYKSEGATSMKAFRAYLHAKSTEAKALNFTIDGDDATGINSLTPALSEGEGAIYNVAGQRMSKMQKGINIVNGKKIMK